MENKKTKDTKDASPVSFKTLEMRLPKGRDGRVLIDWYSYSIKLVLLLAKSAVFILTVSMAWRQAAIFLLNTFIDHTYSFLSDARGRHRDTRRGDRRREDDTRP